MQHTPEQAAVITAPRGNLLVSAAAGSGKTTVLTDRIVGRIIDKSLDVRQVLVMTFTEAAARNMKEKIEKKLREALAATADSVLRQHLGRQISYLPGAAISTIHAFCLDLIRNFYTSARDEQGQPLFEPGFAVDDGVEADLLLRRTLDEWLAEQYEAIDLAVSGDTEAGYDATRQAAFYRLIDGYGSAANDQPVRDLMLRLLQFMRSLPDYGQQAETWLEGLRMAAADFAATPHMEELLRQLRLLLDRALEQITGLEDLLANGIRFISQADRSAEYSSSLAAALAALRRIDGYLQAGGHDWDHIRQLAECLSTLDIPKANKSDSPEKRAFLDIFCRYVAEVVFCLSGHCSTERFSKHFVFKTRHLFSLGAAEIQADIAAMVPAAEMLFELVLGLDNRYTQNKRAAGLIDFSDFEHLALRILREDEARNYYRSRFSEVYVDEYQDTSSIQEKIIQAVSNGNCLMVGDIKQSIYRFRHARPRIFIDRAEQYRAGNLGVLHELNKNFRSVAGILAAANELFRQLMSRGAGEIDYDERQSLVEDRADHPDRPLPASLLLVNSLPQQAEEMPGDENQDLGEGEETAWVETADQTDSLDSGELNRVEMETLAVLAKMRVLREEGSEWREMVVLCRTRAIVQACRSQLEKHAVPVISDSGSTFLDTPVMRQMEALIHLLDNVRQDIPLAAVLRSEIFMGGFDDEELVRIRLFAREKDPGLRFFHEAALAYAEDGPDPGLCRRLTDFFAWLARLREREQILSLSELMGQLFDETGWLERLAAHLQAAVLRRSASCASSGYGRSNSNCDGRVACMLLLLTLTACANAAALKRPLRPLTARRMLSVSSLSMAAKDLNFQSSFWWGQAMA